MQQLRPAVLELELAQSTEHLRLRDALPIRVAFEEREGPAIVVTQAATRSMEWRVSRTRAALAPSSKLPSLTMSPDEMLTTYYLMTYY